MKIAVSDTGREEKQKIYLHWLQSFNPNAELVVASYKNNFDALDGFDGLVLTGGEDVDPELSKATPIESVQQSDRKRDDFEFRLLDQAMKQEMPILGICRGFQVTNVFLGGSLIADLQSAGFQKHNAKKDEQEIRHAIKVNDGTVMQQIIGTTIGEINSNHHQAALTVADDLMISSYSSDNVIESLEWKEKAGKSFLLLVQWHPERMNDNENPFTKNIGSAFFAEAQKFNSKQ